MLDFLLDLFPDVPEPDFEVDDAPDDYAAEHLDGVENGVFVGDADDAEALAEASIIDDADIVDSENIVRNIAARNEFLAAYGYDGVPEGFQVHHVIPLSEGGSDDPSNMVLLPIETHQEITAMHARIYDWHKR